METMTVTAQSRSSDFAQARNLAASTTGKKLTDPVIVAWKDDATGRFGPGIPGGVADRWHDYGKSNGGKLEITIGDGFHFIFSEAADFEEPGLKFAKLTTDDGTTLLCLNEACTEEDRRQLDQQFGGGMGDN